MKHEEDFDVDIHGNCSADVEECIEEELYSTPSTEDVPYDDDTEEIDEDSDEFYRQICHNAFNNYRYVVKEEMFFDIQTGQKYTAKQFNTVVIGNFPLYRKGKKVEYGKAARAFLEGSFYKGLKGIRSEINSVKSAGVITEDLDGDIVNTYVKRGCGSRKGDVTLFHKLMEVLFEYEEDKQLMLKIMKWTVEHAGDPDKRLMFAPFITGIEGNGKSTIVGIMAQIIGERYMISPDASTLRGSFSGFLENALLVNINESEEAKNNSLAEKLKPWITEKFLTIHPKGKEAFKVLNTSTFIITTNNPNALMQTSGSTRFCNFKTRFDSQEELFEYFGGREKKDAFYEELYNWLEKKNGYAKISYYLKNSVSFGKFKGNKGRAPYTKSHDAIMDLQKTDTMKTIEDAIEDLGGIFTLKDFTRVLKEYGSKIPTHTERDSVLKAMNYTVSPQGKYFIQMRISDGSHQPPMRRVAYPATMEQKDAAIQYAKLCKERGEEI